MEPLTIFTVLSTLGAGTWSVWQWSEEQKKARKQKRNVMAALYVNSFIFAAEVLQERLYSILTKANLQANRCRIGQGAQSDGFASPLAIEILYELGQFFGWSNYAFRYGPYTSDEPAIRLLFKISGTFAAEDGFFAGDAFRFSIPEQMALGWAVVKYTGQNIESYPEYQAITLFEFEDELREAEGKKHSLYQSKAVQTILRAIDRAQGPDELEGRERLSEIQGLLVDALNHFEGREKFCVALAPRQKVTGDAVLTAGSAAGGGAQVVHHIRGRIRLRIPGLAGGGTAVQQLRSSLGTMAGLTSLRLNPAANSLIVSYEPGLPMTEVENRLLAAIEQASTGRWLK